MQAVTPDYLSGAVEDCEVNLCRGKPRRRQARSFRNNEASRNKRVATLSVAKTADTHGNPRITQVFQPAAFGLRLVALLLRGVRLSSLTYVVR